MKGIYMAETSGCCAYSFSFSGRQFSENKIMPREKSPTIIDKANQERVLRNIYREETKAKRIESKAPEERTKEEAIFLFGYKTKLAIEKNLNKLKNIDPVHHLDSIG